MVLLQTFYKHARAKCNDAGIPDIPSCEFPGSVNLAVGSDITFRGFHSTFTFFRSLSHNPTHIWNGRKGIPDDDSNALCCNGKRSPHLFFSSASLHATLSNH